MAVVDDLNDQQIHCLLRWFDGLSFTATILCLFFAYLQSGPLDAANTSWGVSPGLLGSKHQFIIGVIIETRLLDGLIDLLDPHFVVKRVQPERGETINNIETNVNCMSLSIMRQKRPIFFRPFVHAEIDLPYDLHLRFIKNENLDPSDM